MLYLGSITSLLLVLSVNCRPGSFLRIFPRPFQRLEASETAEITCFFRSGDCPQAIWNGPALSSGHFTREDSSMQSILRIRNVSTADAGSYSCRCGSLSDSSRLIVIVFPSFENVSTNQTFFIGTTDTIVCDAFPGSPEEIDKEWWHNSTHIVQVELSNRYSLGLNNDLTIEGIRQSDAGVYQCGFITSKGRLFVNITVNVVMRPPTPSPCSEVPRIDLPQKINVRYDHPYNLTCNFTEPEGAIVTYTWIIRDHESRPHRTILIQPESSGEYTCIVDVINCHQTRRHNLFLEVDAPPIIEGLGDEYLPSPVADEGRTLNMRISLQIPIENVTYQWTDMDSRTVKNFTSRLSVELRNHGSLLEVSIMDAQISDAGHYRLSLSNQFGSDEIRVQLIVKRLTNVSVQINEDCTFLENHKSRVALSLEERICGSRSASNCAQVGSAQVNCTSEPAIFSMMIRSRTEIPTAQLGMRVSFTIAGKSVPVTILCVGDQCKNSQVTEPAVGPPRNDAPIITGVIVAVIISVCVLILVLTTMVLKSKKYCYNNRVCGQQNPEDPMDLAPVPAPMQPAELHNRIRGGEHDVQNPASPVEQDNQPHLVIPVEVQQDQQEQPECVGYVQVRRTPAPRQVPVTSTTATPITTPNHPPQQPLHSSSTTPKCPAKRPNRLPYLRSHSYHGSTKTPSS